MSTVRLTVDPKFAAGIAKLAKDFRGAATRSVKEQNEQNYKDAVNLSNKQFLSLQKLRLLGQPYSRYRAGFRGFPVNNPQIINKQSGLFLAGWKRDSAARTRGRWIVADTFNQSEHARWIAISGKGKSRMVKRPIAENIVERNRKQFTRRMLENIRRDMR